MVYLYDACDQISDFCHQQLLRKMRRKISWTDRRREVKQYTPSPFGEGGIRTEVKQYTPLPLRRGGYNYVFQGPIIWWQKLDEFTVSQNLWYHRIKLYVKEVDKSYVHVYQLGPMIPWQLNLKKWWRKLVEIAHEYTGSQNPQYHQYVI